MKYPVLKKFRDKGSGKIYDIGSSYEAEEERAGYLQKLGYIGQDVPAETSEEWPKHAGGGVFELPNGEKVRGKAKAIELMGISEES